MSGSCFRSVTETRAETPPPKWKTFEKRHWPVCGFAHVWPKRTETLRNSEVFIWWMGFHLCWVANFQTRLLRTIRTRSSEMTVCTWKISSCPEVVEFDTDGDTCVQAILDLKWQGYRSLKVDAQAVILFNRSYLQPSQVQRQLFWLAPLISVIKWQRNWIISKVDKRNAIYYTQNN